MVELHRVDPTVKAIRLSRNFGHQAAVAAGLDLAVGEAVIMMDGDLQHPPELILSLLSAWRQGFEIVSTVRRDPGHGGRMKRWSSSAFYRLLNFLAEIQVEPGTADFRLLDRKVVEAIRTFREKGRFLRGVVAWIGFRQVSIPYEAEPRFQGASKYSLRRMFRLALDGIVSFSSVPLYLSAYLGFAVSLLSFAYGAYAIYARLFTSRTVEGWTSVMAAVLFLGGVQLIAIGVLGTYVAQVFKDVKGRPLYIIQEKIGVHAE